MTEGVYSSQVKVLAPDKYVLDASEKFIVEVLEEADVIVQSGRTITLLSIYVVVFLSKSPPAHTCLSNRRFPCKSLHS